MQSAACCRGLPEALEEAPPREAMGKVLLLLLLTAAAVVCCRCCFSNVASFCLRAQQASATATVRMTLRTLEALRGGPPWGPPVRAAVAAAALGRLTVAHYLCVRTPRSPTAAAATTAATTGAAACAGSSLSQLRRQQRKRLQQQQQQQVQQQLQLRQQLVLLQQQRRVASESVAALLRQMEGALHKSRGGAPTSAASGGVVAATAGQDVCLCEGLADARLGDRVFLGPLEGAPRGAPSRVGFALEVRKRHVVVGVLQSLPAAAAEAPEEGAACSIQEMLHRMQQQQQQQRVVPETPCSLILDQRSSSSSGTSEEWRECGVSAELLSPADALLLLHREAEETGTAAGAQRAAPALQLWRSHSQQLLQQPRNSSSSSSRDSSRPVLLRSGWAPLDSLLPLHAGDTLLLQGPQGSGKTQLLLQSLALWLQQLSAAAKAAAAEAAAVLVVLGASPRGLAQQLGLLRKACAAAQQQQQHADSSRSCSRLRLKILYVNPLNSSPVSAFAAPLLGLRLAHGLQSSSSSSGAAAVLAVDGMDLQAAAAVEVAAAVQQLLPAAERHLGSPFCQPQSMYGLLACDGDTPAAAAAQQQALLPLTRVFSVDTSTATAAATAAAGAGTGAAAALAPLATACISFTYPAGSISSSSSSNSNKSRHASLDWPSLLQQSPQRVLAEAFGSLSSCCFSPTFAADAPEQRQQQLEVAAAAAEALVRASRSTSSSSRSRAAAQPLLLRIAAAAFIWQQQRLQQELVRQRLLQELRLQQEDHEASELHSLGLAAAVVGELKHQPLRYRSLPQQLLLLRAAAFYFFDPYYDSSSSSSGGEAAEKAAAFSEELLQLFPDAHASLWAELCEHLGCTDGLAAAAPAAAAIQEHRGAREEALVALQLLHRVDEALLSLREGFSLTRTQA
ncbi:hypothetical protein Esti_006401 [Eimeria stiedai]